MRYKAAFKKNTFNNNHIGALCYVVHQLQGTGNFRGSIFLGKELIQVFELNCSDDSNATQVDIDLGQLNSASLITDATSYTVGKEGYVLFYNSVGDAGYKIIIEQSIDSKWKKCFDSTALKKHDLFVFMPMQPGLYEVCDPKNGCVTKLKVLYPNKKNASKRAQILKPLVINQSKDGYALPRGELRILPGQGFMINSDVSHTVDAKLVEAFEETVPRTSFNLKRKRSLKSNRRKHRWENPHVSDDGK